MSKKVSRRGKLENGSVPNRGLLLDAYTENTSQQKSDSEKFKEGYVKKKKGKTQPKVAPQVLKTPEPSPDQGRRVPKPRFGTLVPEEDDPPPVEAVDSWEDIEAPVMPVPKKVVQENRKKQEKSLEKAVKSNVETKENIPAKVTSDVVVKNSAQDNKTDVEDKSEKGDGNKEKTVSRKNKDVSSQVKERQKKQSGDDLADILDNLQIDENKQIVRRSDRKTGSELLKEETERVLELLRSGEDDRIGIKVEVFPEKGRGIVTTKDRVKGEFVVEYAGDLINIDSANQRENEYSMDVSKGCYMYYFKHQGRQYCVDATEETGRLGRLLNHSCKHPNLITKVMMVDSSPRLYLVAKHDMKAGTELVYDYGDRDKATIKAHPWLAM